MKKWWKSRTIILTLLVGGLMLADLFSDFLPGKVPQYVSGLYAITVFVLRTLDNKNYKKIMLGQEAAKDAAASFSKPKTDKKDAADKETADA